MSQQPKIMMPEVFIKAVEVFYVDCQAKGMQPLDKSGKLASVEIDETWVIHTHASDEKEQEYGFPSFSIKVVYNGWPAGIIYHDGGIIAAGEAANEDTFIVALDQWLEQHRSSE